MIDVVIEGWLLLLPESKRQILSRNGEFDELMFQANMAIHALTLSNHRQFSALALNPVERISSCLSNAPDNCFCTSVGYETIHTARCLQAIEAQIRLISLQILSDWSEVGCRSTSDQNEPWVYQIALKGLAAGTNDCARDPNHCTRGTGKILPESPLYSVSGH